MPDPGRTEGGSRLRSLAGATAFFAALAWPVALHREASTPTLTALAATLVAALLLRLLVSNAEPAYKTIGLVLALGLLCLAVVGGQDELLRWQPSLLNLALLGAFAYSLVRGMPLIERIARARRMPVGAHNLGYLRVLTGVWVGFFALAFGLSTWAALEPGPWWRLWNGRGMYAALAVLVVGERLYRIAYRARLRRDGRLPDT